MLKTIIKSVAVTAVAAVSFSSGAFAQGAAQYLNVPFKVNAAATVTAVQKDSIVLIEVEENVQKNLRLPLQINVATSVGNTGKTQGRLNAPTVSASRGNISLRLPTQSYQNAEIGLYSINGKRVMRGKADASNAASSLSRRNVAAGVYMLSVKGANGSAFTKRLTHSGGKMNINVAFGAESVSPARQLGKGAEDGGGGDGGVEWDWDWVITILPVEGDEWYDSTYTINLRGYEQYPLQNIELIGVYDWSVVSAEFDGEVLSIPDYFKIFYSLKLSNDLVITNFEKYGDYWIESVQEVGKYSIKGDSVCVDGTCNKYSISGNNLTFSMLEEICSDGPPVPPSVDDVNEEVIISSECQTYSVTYHAVKANLANTKKSLGNSLKSQDPALKYTEWKKSDSDYEWVHIWFGGSYFGDWYHVYISDEAYDVLWYTEGGNRLTLVSMKCDGYETVKEDDDEWERCTSTSVDKTVTLDYQLTNGTLRLRPTGSSAWDTWTPYSYDVDEGSLNKSKANAKSKKDRRRVNPFKFFRK